MKLAHDVAIRQTTGLKLSQELTHAIGFLELSTLELVQSLRDAASDNPWLRLTVPRGLEQAHPEAADAGPSLIAHVLDRLPALVPRKADRAIAIALAEALDGAGFVTVPLDEIARRTDRPSRRVEAVLQALQRIEPRGLFARSLSECLALQLAETGCLDAEMKGLLAVLPVLAEGGPEALARAAGLAPDRLATQMARLRDLDPRPAAAFSHETLLPRVADLVFRAEQGGWKVQLNPETTPLLSLAAMPEGGLQRGSRLSRERRSAQGLMRALERRNRSLLAVGGVLAREQAGFLARGVQALRPLTMRMVAVEIGLHESSVGRLVNASSAATASGTVPLRAFFCRPASNDMGRAVLGKPAIVDRIAAVVAAGDDDAGLSDARIRDLLAAEGIAISRRVVAKYRAEAGIPNRSARRRIAAEGRRTKTV